MINLNNPPKTLKGWIKKTPRSYTSTLKNTFFYRLEWKNRYFILENGVLYYYKNELVYPPYDGDKLKGTFNLKHAMIIDKNKSLRESINQLIILSALSTEGKLELEFDNNIMKQQWLVTITEHIEYANQKENESLSLFINNNIFNSFWLEKLNPSIIIKTSEFINKLNEYFQNQLNLNLFNRILEKNLYIMINNLDKNKDHLISIIEFKQSLRLFQYDDNNQDNITLFEIIEFLVFHKYQKIIIPSLNIIQNNQHWNSNNNNIKMKNNMNLFTIWDNNNKNQLINIFFPIQSSYTFITGLSGIGKTHRILSLSYELIVNNNSDSILWIDMNNSTNELDIWLNIQNELCLQGNNIEEYKDNFKSLLRNIIEMKENKTIENHCTIILDHVINETLYFSQEIFKIIDYILLSSNCYTIFNVIIISNQELITAINYNIPNTLKLQTLIEIPLFTIEEVKQLYQYMKIPLQNNLIKNLENKKSYIPQEILCMMLYSNHNHNINLQNEDLFDNLLEVDIICAHCLYPCLITGYIFDISLAWYLSIDYIENIDLMKKSIQKLISIGWLKLKSDQGYIIPSTSINPKLMKNKFKKSDIIIDNQVQCDKYYQYICYQIQLINNILLSKNWILGCMKYDLLHQHIELVLSNLSSTSLFIEKNPFDINNNDNTYANNVANNTSTQINVKLLLPSERDSLLLKVLNNFEGILKYRLSIITKREAMYQLYEDGLQIIKKYKRSEDNEEIGKLLYLMSFIYLDKIENNLDLYQQALIIFKKNNYLNESNDMNLLLYNEALNLYKYKGNSSNQEVLDILKDVLSIRKKIYGNSHTYVADVVLNIAYILGDNYQNNEAFLLYDEAMVIYQSNNGIYHSSIANTLILLANMLENLGNTIEAIEKYKQALFILKKFHCNEDTIIISTVEIIIKLIRNLARDQYNIDNDQKGSIFHKEAISIAINIYGEDHLYVAKVMNNIGSELNDLDRNIESLVLLEQALVIRKKRYHNNNHPEIATTLNNLGLVFDDLKRWNESLIMYQQAYIIYNSFYGNEHPSIARTLYNIGSVYKSLDHKTNALESYNKSLIISKKIYGDDHIDVRDLLESIAQLKL